MNVFGKLKQEIGSNSSSLVDQALVSGSTFLTVVLCAHFLPPSEQGKLGYVLGFYLAALTLNMAMVFQGASVRTASEADKSGYLTVLFVIQFVVAVVITVLLLTVLSVFGSSFGWIPSPHEAAYLAGFLFFQQLADFERRTAYIFTGGGQALGVSLRTYPARIVTLLVIAPTTIEAVLLITMLTSLLGAISIGSKWNAIKTAQGEKLQRAWEHLRFSAWLMVSAPLNWMWAHIPTFALGLIRGPESVAILVSLRSLATATNVIVEQVEIQIPVRMARRRHQSGIVAVEEIARMVHLAGTLFWMVGLVGILLAGKWIIALLFGQHYQDYAPLLAILWVAYWLQFLAKVYALKHRALYNLRVESLGSLGAVVSALLLAYPLIHVYGVYGAGWLTLATALLVGGMQYLAARLFQPHAAT